MTKITFNPRVLFTLIVIAFITLHLGLETLNGGVVTHHLLANEDMPGVSNWWGLVLLPALAWFLHPFMQSAAALPGVLGLSSTALYRLGGAIAYGSITAVSFEFGAPQLTGLMVGLLVPLGIVTPLYRAELLLGMIIGMTFTFGAILPTIVACVLGTASFVTNNTARFVISKVHKANH